MKIYALAVGNLSTFADNLNSLVLQGYAPESNIISYNDGSQDGNPLLIQLVSIATGDSDGL